MSLAVFTTLHDEALARALARGAVERKLAACVHIERIESVYRWDGAVQEEPEYRLLFKSTQEAYEALAAYLLADHPYELPALWAVPMTHGSAPFLRWIAENSAGEPESPNA